MVLNPFTPVFGNEPPVIGGRDRFIKDVLTGLDNLPGDPNRVTIFVGPRGSGKTVLLAHIADAAEQRGWISVHTPAMAGMLREIKEQVERRAVEHLPVIKNKSHITGVQVSGIGITRALDPAQEVTWRTAMDGYLDILAEKNIGLLFTIDEVRLDIPELISFISTFQVFIMQKRNVALLLAGLPGNVIQLISDENISFLRRAFRRTLEPISAPEVRAVLRKTIALTHRKIDDDALEYAAQKTSGLPFMIQLVGYHTFNQSESKTIILADAKQGFADARSDLQSMVLETTIADLTATELRFLEAMLPDDGSSSVSTIAQRMQTSDSQASHYRRRLLDQDILVQSGRGKIEFAMPLLKELLREM